MAASSPDLPSEMLSGPDTGGGFLFQLTLERGGPKPGFTFHAQEGAEDAGGPPKGSPEPLGYRHPEAACMYGGPRCWHRRFALPPSEAMRVRTPYNRTRLTFAAQIEQVAGLRPVPVAEGIRELLDLVYSLTSESVPWFIGASAGAWIQGVHVVPRDVDIGTNARGAARLAELLELYLIEPLSSLPGPEGTEAYCARAFVGTARDGIRVEWRSGQDQAGESGTANEFGRVEAGSRFRTVTWQGRVVPVAPVEFAIARWLARDEKSRWEAVEEFRSRHALNGGQLRSAVAGLTLSKEAVEQLKRWTSVPSRFEA